jgi:hypothetical protein
MLPAAELRLHTQITNGNRGAVRRSVTREAQMKTRIARLCAVAVAAATGALIGLATQAADLAVHYDMRLLP